jgi:zinc transporter 2
VEQDLLDVDGILAVHDLHIWVLTVGKAALAVHVELPEGMSTREYARVLDDAQHLLCDKYGIHHTTIQLEETRIGGYMGHCKSSLCNGGICSGARISPSFNASDAPIVVEEELSEA